MVQLRPLELDTILMCSLQMWKNELLLIFDMLPRNPEGALTRRPSRLVAIIETPPTQVNKQPNMYPHILPHMCPSALAPSQAHLNTLDTLFQMMNMEQDPEVTSEVDPVFYNRPPGLGKWTQLSVHAAHLEFFVGTICIR